MKKTLIALAAVAATSAAFAQSSVTLYGRVDASIGQEKSLLAGGVSTTKLFNGSDAGLTGSRWGMRGTEDLGGGLKAVFDLENRFNVDDGTSGGGFLGNAFVGLTGGFGTVHLGRSYNAYDYTQDLSVRDNVFDSAFTADYNRGNATRSANMIKYVSPTIAGFTAVASTGLAEGAVGGKNQNGLSVGYAAGPLAVRVGGQADAAGDSVGLSAGYNFGVASISGGYSQLSAPNNGNDSAGYTLGVTVPMGAFKFSAGFASGEVENNAGAKQQETTAFGLGATYSLSKRTTAYVGYRETKHEDAAGVKVNQSATDTSKRLFAVGVRHDF